MPNKNDLTGRKFNRLSVVKDSGQRTVSQKILWECLCDCGAVTLVVGANLLNGNTQSCGCLQKEGARKRLLTHGRSGTYEYERGIILQKNYGISLEFVRKLSEKQNHCCAICFVPESSLGECLSVDHDHETGEVRGLLCRPCNLGIGYLKDSIPKLQGAINYLTKTHLEAGEPLTKETMQKLKEIGLRRMAENGHTD